MGSAFLVNKRKNINKKKTPRIMCERKIHLTGFCITLETQHDLGRSIPPRSDVFCHETDIGFGIVAESSCQTEITNLEFTIRIHQQVAWLQVAVEDIGRVDIFESSTELVDKVLEMSIRQGLFRADNLVQIGFHEFLDQVAGISIRSPQWQQRQ
jgi:hypothetical protein